MIYRRINRTNNNNKIIGAAAITFLILAGITFYGFKELFLNKNNDSKYNSLLYTQVLNSAMPIVRVTSFEDEVFAEENITIKGEILKLIGINIYNPILIMSREISFFNNVAYGTEVEREEPGKQESGKGIAMNITPFDLPSEQINNTTPSVSNGTNTGGAADSPIPNKVVDVQNPNIKQSLNNAKPQILIYHTHTSESFAPNGNHFPDDPKKNICDIGDALTYELETNYGISVIHDKTIHDSVYNNSYYRSRETVDLYMEKYGNFDLVIDMHRDAGYSKSSFTTKMNGENVAKMAFVLTKKNPHYDKNAKVVNELMTIGNKIFPGFVKDTFYFNYGSKYFNQDKSNNAILVEVGANINTHEEAKNSAKYMARIMAEYLNDKK